MDRITLRMNSWTSKRLSFAAIIISCTHYIEWVHEIPPLFAWLLQSVLSIIQNFWVDELILPKKVIKNIEQKFYTFFVEW